MEKDVLDGKEHWDIVNNIPPVPPLEERDEL